MRAKSVISKAFIWDFDDTLFKTEAKVHVYHKQSGKHIKSLNPDQFNSYKKLPSHLLDFRDFADNDIILNAIPYKSFPLLAEIDQEVSEGKINGDIFILTARTSAVQKAIYELLQSLGIKNMNYNNIICMGDSMGHINIAEGKKNILKSIKDQYDRVYFYDDNKENIEKAKKEGINTYLIENI